jgi:hypothetical protein
LSSSRWYFCSCADELALGGLALGAAAAQLGEQRHQHRPTMASSAMPPSTTQRAARRSCESCWKKRSETLDGGDGEQLVAVRVVDRTWLRKPPGPRGAAMDVEAALLGASPRRSRPAARSLSKNGVLVLGSRSSRSWSRRAHDAPRAVRPRGDSASAISLRCDCARISACGHGLGVQAAAAAPQAQ